MVNDLLGWILSRVLGVGLIPQQPRFAGVPGSLACSRRFGFDPRLQSELEATADDAVKTSAIEGIVETLLDAIRKFDEPLTDKRIFGWHAGLFPTGYSGMHRIDVGSWRQDKEGPMQVVSEDHGRQCIHCEARPRHA